MAYVLTGRVKPFDDLMYHPTTLGMQMSTNSEASDLEPQGLCVGRPLHGQGVS
jgi:hypothetical protein